MHPHSVFLRFLGLWNISKGRNRLFAIGAGVILGGMQQSSGCLRPDGTDDADYVSYGVQFQTKLLSFKVLIPGIGVGYRYGSAVYLNREYALTAAHNFTDLLQFNPSYEVGTGSSYSTNAGTVVSATVTAFPGYDPNNRGSTIDLAIIHFSSPLSGVETVITNASAGQVLTHAGFGMFGTPSTGAQTKDGNSRAWKAKLGTLPVQSGFSDNFYFATDFGPYIPNNGKALSGDSGGAVYDGSTNLVGIIIAQTGDTSTAGATICLNLLQPEIYSWIQTNTHVAIEPPPSLSIGCDATLAILGATNQVYRIEATTNFLSWQEVGRVTNNTGSVTFQDSQFANFQTRFYRAVVE